MAMENSLWISSRDLIPGLNNEIFLHHIYSVLTPQERAVSSCVNRDWAQVHRVLNYYGRLKDFVISGRKLRCLPRVPSLIVFNKGTKRCSNGFKQYRSWWSCTMQFFFDANGRNNSGRCQVNRFSDLPSERIRLAPRHYYIPCAIGSTIVMMNTVLQKKEAAFIGHLESSESWLWILTTPLEPPPALSDVPVFPMRFQLHVILVGWLVIKLRTVVDETNRCLAYGSYYDVHSKQWCHLTSLYQPDNVAHRMILHDAFQWNNRLFVTGHRYIVGEDNWERDGLQRVCNYYNFETQTWNEWNGTSELMVLASALEEMQRILGVTWDGSFNEAQFGASTDGTLFVVSSNINNQNIVYFLRTDECVAGEFEWAYVPIPTVVDVGEKHYNTKIWPLEGNDGIVIVSQVVVKDAMVGWWFLKQSGVYARGTFHICDQCSINGSHYARTKYALIHTDI